MGNNPQTSPPAYYMLVDKKSYAQAASLKGEAPVYMICQTQKKKAIGVIIAPDFWPDLPHYMGFKATEDEMKPPLMKFQIGQRWMVKGFDWHAGYEKLDSREVGGASFKRTNTGEHKGNKPIMFEETINCQAFAKDDEFEKDFDPPSKEVVAVIARSKGKVGKGMVLLAYAADLLNPARIEEWSACGFTLAGKKPGDKVLLGLNKLPKGTWIGTRYVFPPQARWHSVKDVKAKRATYVATHAKEYQEKAESDRDKAVRDEQLFIVNTQLKIEGEEEDEKKYAIRTDLVRIPEEENIYALLVEGTMAYKGEDHDFLVGIMSRWDKGVSIEVRQHAQSQAFAFGKIRGRTWNEKGRRWRLEIIAWLVPFGDSSYQLNRIVTERKMAYASIPSQTFKLKRMMNDMRQNVVARVAGETSPRGRILRKILGLKKQAPYTCTVDHAADLAPYLNQRQLEAANRFLCHHTIGDVIPIQAPFGTGKTRSLRWMVAYLVARYPDAVVAVMCSMNIPLIDLVRDTLGILQEENIVVPTTVLLSRRAMDEFMADIRQAQLEQYIHTLDYDDQGMPRGIGNKEVMEKIKDSQPRLIFVTPDKASMMPEVLGRATHVVTDEAGRLYQIVAAHLVASAPLLQKLILAADKEQPTTQSMGGLPLSFVRESTGYTSILDMVMKPSWEMPIVEYDRSYRGHPVVTRDLSEAIYFGKLRPALTEQERQWFIDSGMHVSAAGYPVILLDNQTEESSLAYSNSCYNEEETTVALRIYARFIELKDEGRIPEEATIGIVCYYKAAIDYTKMRAEQQGLVLSDSDINSVDAMIGGERDFIIMLTSKTRGSSPFLMDPQRATAAWTRQKHGLIVIANFAAYAARGRTWRIVNCVTRHTPILGTSALNSNKTLADALEVTLAPAAHRTRNQQVLLHGDRIPLAKSYDTSFNRKWAREEQEQHNAVRRGVPMPQETKFSSFNRSQQRRFHQ